MEDDTLSQSPSVTANNKRNSSGDGYNSAVGGGIIVPSTLGKRTS